VCPNLAKIIASENNDKSIEESTKFFNSTVKQEEDDWVLPNEHNFLQTQEIGRNI
jgi:hypothetical protein